jgi:hypothetical protein
MIGSIEYLRMHLDLKIHQISECYPVKKMNRFSFNHTKQNKQMLFVLKETLFFSNDVFCFL